MDNKSKVIIIVMILLWMLVAFVIGWVVGLNSDYTDSPEINSNVTIPQISNITEITWSNEKALYGMIYDSQYVLGEYPATTMWLWVKGSEGMYICCNSYVFEGYVQGVPIGAEVMIVYREYTVDYVRYLVVVDIEVLKG